MEAIPQGPTLRRFCALLLVGLIASACQDTASTSTQTQRQIGEARLADNIFLSLTYGAVRGFTEEKVVLRSASPLIEISLESGSGAVGPIEVELRNQHLDAELRVAAVRYLDSEDLDGCPVVSGFEVDCVAAAQEIGATCDTSGQCPDGLRCAANTCQPSDAFGLCVAPAAERLQGQQTSIGFELPVAPCTRTRLETFLRPSDAPLRFAVLGPTRDVEVLRGLGEEFRARGLDFVVLLGDQISSANEAGLAELERALTQLGTPAVVIAGPREVATEKGAEFLRRFGPHDHVWRLKGARFFAFYSASSSLGNRGLVRLAGFLNQLAEGETTDTPLIGVSHVPPFDPNDLRDSAFHNEIEASQLVSLLEEKGVHQLYTGGLGTGYERLLDLETFVTTARGTLTQPQGEWIEVVIESDGEGRLIGETTVDAHRIDL